MLSTQSKYRCANDAGWIVVAAVPDGVPGGLRQRTHLDEPLLGQPRLDDGVAPRAVPDGVQVGPLLRDDPALLAQGLDDGRAGLEPVQPLEGPGRGDDAPVVEHGDRGQPVALADLEVVRVVRRRHLDRAGAEARVDVVVGDDRDPASGQRQLHLAADEVRVTLVVRMHGDGGVAEHRLGPGGRDDDRVRRRRRSGC